MNVLTVWKMVTRVAGESAERIAIDSVRVTRRVRATTSSCYVFQPHSGGITNTCPCGGGSCNSLGFSCRGIHHENCPTGFVSTARWWCCCFG
jgi:hypothetical protein